MKVPHIDLKLIQTNRTHTNKKKHFYAEEGEKIKLKKNNYIWPHFIHKKNTLKYTIIII